MHKPSEIQKILSSIRKNVNKANKRRSCIIKGCDNPSINSHLLQENGILDYVAENRHLYEIRPTDIMKWTSKKSKPLDFKFQGITKAFSLHLLCKYHDNKIFSKIEKDKIHLDDYESLLLLSYRVLLSEIRKKENNIDHADRMINAQSFKNIPGLIQDSVKVKIGANRGIQDLLHYNSFIESNLNNLNKNDFEFKRFKFRPIKIYSSAIISVANDLNIRPYHLLHVHIIPNSSELNIVFGFHKKYVDIKMKSFINSWNCISEKELQIKLTKLFAGSIENWGMSKSIFDTINNLDLNQFVEYYTENVYNFSLDHDINFNLFKNI